MSTEHASAVAWHGRGVLIRGGSGIGKSSLALGLIEQGALLVADDQVTLHAGSGDLLMTAPTPLAGLLEIRGVGITRWPYLISVRVALVVELVPSAQVERLADLETTRLLDCHVPIVCLSGGPLAPSQVAAILRARPSL